MMDICGKRILILGGSSEGIVTVKSATEMGLKTIVVDPDPDAPAKKVAWKSYDVDALDLDALVDIFRVEQVDGVFVGLSERLLETYCRLCAEVGTSCYCTLDQIDIFCDKIKFKEKCREYGIPVIHDYSLDDDIKFPVLVKPADSSGSKGITVCYNRGDLSSAIDKAKRCSHTQRYIIEDYLEGDQLTANYNVINGEPYLSLINDRYVVKPYENLGSVGIAVVFPSKNAKLYVETIHDNMRRMIKDLGFQNAPINLQAFVDGETIRFYDPALRFGGGRSYLITENIFGYNIQKMLLRFAVTGEMLSANNQMTIHDDDWKIKGKHSLQANLIVKTGRIGRVEGMDQLKEIDCLIDAIQTRMENDVITLAGTSQQTTVRLYFVADDINELISSYEKALSKIKIYDENGEDMLLEPFDLKKYYDHYARG